MKAQKISLVGLGLAAALATVRVVGAPPERVLTTAAQILELSAEEAKLGYRLAITGVVTVAETSTNWRGKFFVQDETGGVFVNNTNKNQPLVGDLIYVRGVAHAGGYAPDIVRPNWHKLGTAPLPAAKIISAEQLMSGAEDGQRVEVTGVVRSAVRGATKLILELASGGYRFRVFVPGSVSAEPDALLGAVVRVRGTSAASFNAPLRHILTVAMYVPQPSDFSVDQWPETEIAKEPFTPLDAIAQYRHDNTPSRRIRVKGVVTHQRLGTDVFLHDASGGMLIKCRETNSYAPGEVVEAVGFPGLEHYLPVLQDATLIRTAEKQSFARPEPVDMEELLVGRHHSDPITLPGKLLERSVRRASGPGGTREFQTILTLQNSNLLFTAESDSTEDNEMLAAIPNGSQLEVSGICALQMNEDGKMQSIRILLPKANGIRVLQKPSWWTPERLFIGFAGSVVVLLLAITWAVTIMRRNAALRASIAEKISAQQELQRAHDLLDWRVKERTKQLKFEMTARKEAEVQFNATLTERTRLAQELHDTLEQSLTGIKLQLDATNRLLPAQPDRANHHLGLARNMMAQSQIELRRSIWDLRSRELQQFDLCSALRAGGQQLLDGGNIELQVETEGEVRPLSEIIEENLLRMGQEALTNVAKHSEAKAVRVQLRFLGNSVELHVQDDGKGFDPATAASAGNGHFGLTGMRERAKRVAGELAIESAPGQGTRIAVTIPLFAPPAEKRPEAEPSSDFV